MKEFLTPLERNELKITHRLEKDRRTADRMKALLLADKGWTFKDIAEALLLDEETISKHVKDYTEAKKLRIQTGGSFSKLDASQTRAIVAYLEETTYTKVSDICAYILEKYSISYTVSGMTFWLKHHGFSYKKPKEIPSQADPIKQEEFIKFYDNLMKTTPEDEPILFGDGVHPTMATKVTYGWIKKGTDKSIATTASRTRMNLMGAINLETMMIVIDAYETLDSEAMASYFTLLKTRYPNAPRIHLILDQGPYNTSAKTKEAAKRLGVILHYLPPYSPNCNPSERVWKVMNEYVRNNRFFKSAKEFRDAIMYFFRETWPQIASSMVERINDNFQCFKKSLV